MKVQLIKRYLLPGKPQAIYISRVKRVKCETAPTSESAQFILAWRSEDSVESAESSQSEALAAALFQKRLEVGDSKKSGVRAVSKNT